LITKFQYYDAINILKHCKEFYCKYYLSQDLNLEILNFSISSRRASFPMRPSRHDNICRNNQYIVCIYTYIILKENVIFRRRIQTINRLNYTNNVDDESIFPDFFAISTTIFFWIFTLRKKM